MIIYAKKVKIFAKKVKIQYEVKVQKYCLGIHFKFYYLFQ